MTDRTRILLLLGPALVLVGGMVLSALGLALLRSLHLFPVVAPDLSAYATVLGSPGFLASLALSVWIATVSTALAAALALALALLLRRGFPGRGMVAVLMQLNLTVPHVVGAIGLLYLVSQSGAFARLAHAAGLIARPGEFPALTHDPYAIGIILTYIWKEVPFITLILLAKLQTLGEGHEQVARSLGATRWQAFRHVLLPQLAPALAAASALVFAFAFGAYEIPLILGAHAPEALPVAAWRAFTDVDLTRRPQAFAISVLVAGLGIALLLLYARLTLPQRGRHAG